MTTKKHPHDNTTAAQQSRLLDRLRKNGSVSTLEARRKLDILHPAGRVLELRRFGYPIKTVWVKEATSRGRVHRVGKYVLGAGDGAPAGKASVS